MATSMGANTYNRLNWEESDFPILCQTCLGDNPYIRMTKEKWGQECKICDRPFTVFRWCPGAKMRFKKTEICQTCSKIKNICQTCLLDLEYGLPTQVRDVALKMKEELPKSSVNKEYYIQNMEKELAETHNPLGKMQNPNDMLLKLARTAPYYKRNRPHICSFWVKGECKRGEECPYRHDKPTDPDDPLSDQNIKDRYYGVNDPVANKLLKRAHEMPKLEAPDDKTITTLYVGNLGEGKVTEKDLRNFFYQYGEIRSVSVITRQQCAFIQFTTRMAAENAAEQSYNKLILCGRRLVLKWGKSQGQLNRKQIDGDAQHLANLLPPVPGLPAALPLPPETVVNYFNLSNSTAPPGMSGGDLMGSGGGVINNVPPPPPQLMPFETLGKDSAGSSKSEDTLVPLMIPPPPPSMQSAPSPFQMIPTPAMLTPHYHPGSGTNRAGAIHYPSQDPQREGSTLKSGGLKPEEKIAEEYAEPD